MSEEDDLNSEGDSPGEDAPSNPDEFASNVDDTIVEKSHRKRGTLIVVAVVVVVALAIATVLAIEAWNSDDNDDTLVSADSTQTSATSSEAPETSSPASTSPASTTDVAGEPTLAPTTAPASTTPATTAPATSTPATGAPTTSTPATGAPATSAPESADPLSEAIWPSPDSDVRYSDPVEAARTFANDFVGFVGANFGEFQADNSGSGHVEVRLGEAGPATEVFVSQLADDGSWWVTGAGTQNIVVQQPDALTAIQSPLTITGLARALDGKVDVELRADGTDAPLFEGSVTGGSGSELEPYEETFEFDSPEVGGGTLLLTTSSPDSGNVLEAEVLRYFFTAR